MKKSTLLLLGSVALLAVSSPLFAQPDGCVGSPENPTVVLALVGSAGAFLASTRTRLRARRNKLQK